MTENIEEGIERLATLLMEQPSKVDEMLKRQENVYGFELMSPGGRQFFIPLSDVFGYIGKEFIETLEAFKAANELLE
jgi:hypothetical protein